MNWKIPALYVIAIAAAGCASEPPRQIPPELEGWAVPQAPQEPSTAIAVLDLEATRDRRPERDPKRVYQWVSALPEAESRELRFYLENQTFEYLEDGRVLVSGPIASGKPSSPTPTGSFTILSKQKDKVSSLYDNEIGTPAWMPYSLQFYGNYFIHEGWLPGYAASHGCIRLGHYDARLLFERTKIGDPVKVEQ